MCRSMARYKGAHEQRQTVQTKSVSNNQSLPLPVVGVTGKTKSCSFCKSACYNLSIRCLKINLWNGTMLTRNKNETNQRDNFIKQLRNSALAYSINFLPMDKYQSNALHKIGTGTKGLVIHARYATGQDVNVMIKCTLLEALGEPCDVNKNVLI